MRRTALALFVFTLHTISGQGRALAQDWVSLAPDGTTEIRLTRPGQKEARVRMTTVRVPAADHLFPVGDSFVGLSEVSLVRDLKILVGTDEVFVGRSVFADFVSPSRLMLRPQGRDYLLIVGCRDGAEAFTAEISFNSSLVTRRKIFSGLTPRDPSEDTRYRLTIFGQ